MCFTRTPVNMVTHMTGLSSTESVIDEEIDIESSTDESEDSPRDWMYNDRNIATPVNSGPKSCRTGSRVIPIIQASFINLLSKASAFIFSASSSDSAPKDTEEERP